jgi:hypothetical protein
MNSGDVVEGISVGKSDVGIDGAKLVETVGLAEFTFLSIVDVS